MAIGPLARLLAQLVVPLIAVLARAIPAAYGQALANARKAGVTPEDAAKGASALYRKTLTKQEALQILNLNEKEAVSVEAIQKQFDRYMAANEVKDGTGSFYLQSKVYRAKELLDEYLKEQRLKEKEQKEKETEQ